MVGLIKRILFRASGSKKLPRRNMIILQYKEGYCKDNEYLNIIRINNGRSKFLVQGQRSRQRLTTPIYRRFEVLYGDPRSLH